MEQDIALEQWLKAGLYIWVFWRPALEGECYHFENDIAVVGAKAIQLDL
jgi:hypothetical protein